MFFNKKILFVLLELFWALPNFAQTIDGVKTDGSRRHNIIAAVPFLSIIPQARAGAIGNAGVAIDADANASTLNVSSLAFLPNGSNGAALSYSPWLKSLAPDMNLAFLSGFYQLDDFRLLSEPQTLFSSTGFYQREIEVITQGWRKPDGTFIKPLRDKYGYKFDNVTKTYEKIKRC